MFLAAAVSIVVAPRQRNGIRVALLSPGVGVASCSPRATRKAVAAAEAPPEGASSRYHDDGSGASAADDSRGFVRRSVVILPGATDDSPPCASPPPHRDPAQRPRGVGFGLRVSNRFPPAICGLTHVRHGGSRRLRRGRIRDERNGELRQRFFSNSRRLRLLRQAYASARNRPAASGSSP
jgi:hypothetical protein